MSNPDHPSPTVSERVDGRVARRQRNIDAVVDVVLEMFTENARFPTMEQAAARSGISPRSLYRYFSDPGELLEASIRRYRERMGKLAKLHQIGQGPLADRIDAFVSMRIRLYVTVAPVFRATIANVLLLERACHEQAINHGLLRKQFELQFAPEIAERSPADGQALVAVGDVLTQLESIDFLWRHRELSEDEVRHGLISGLTSLLT